MCRTSRFTTRFGNQHVDGSQSLRKSARHHFYTIALLVRDKLSRKKTLLVRFEIRFEVRLGLFLNTMTTDDKISRRNRDYFPQKIQTKLSQEPKTFSQFFFPFLNSKSIFEYFETEEESHSLRISEINDSERGRYLNV